MSTPDELKRRLQQLEDELGTVPDPERTAEIVEEVRDVTNRLAMLLAAEQSPDAGSAQVRDTEDDT